MRNIGEKLFGPRDGEPVEVHDKRTKELSKLIKNTFDTVEGRKLMKELVKASPPLEPRFGKDRSPEEAAFLDGEKHFLGLLLIHSGLR